MYLHDKFIFHSGQCWAIEGSQGYLVLQLGAPIRVSGVSFVLGKNVKDASSAPRTVSISAEPFVEPLMNVTLPQRASEEVTFMLEEESLSSISRVKIEVCSHYRSLNVDHFSRSWKITATPRTPASTA